MKNSRTVTEPGSWRRVRTAFRGALFALLALCGAAQAQAQTVVTGTVVDDKGEPVPSAAVVIKGTTSGTVTDFDGNYSLPGVPSDATLVVSFIGYKTQEVPVAGQSKINFTLASEFTELDEVVAVGYGTVTKRDLTGSVSSMSSKDLVAIPVSGAAEAMTGKMAGVAITTTEGSPDADVKIRVRGGGSLSQDNSPLYIVDGFPVSSIADIAPSEIESLDVLKDASSTAIYGARGANGVIIITTKGGHDGKAQVNAGVSYGWRKVTKLTKTMDPYNFALYQYELGSTDYGDFQDLDIWKSAEGYDYQDDIFGRWGHTFQANANVSGGTKDFKYNVGYSHQNEKSIMEGSGYSKENVNVKLQSQLNKWLKLDFNGRLSYQKIEGLGSGADSNESNAANSIVANSAKYRPIERLTVSSDDDDETTNTAEKSPSQRQKATDKVQRRFQQNYNAAISWTPIKELTIRSEVGYGWRFENTDQAWSADAVQNSKLGDNGMPQAIFTRKTSSNWRNANTITYDNKKLVGGRDRLNIVVGHEVTSSNSKTRESTSVRFPNTFSIDEVYSNTGVGDAQANQGNIGAKENLLSFFGRINYTLMDKYLMTFVIRGDGSSKFADGNRWGVFPSGAVAWRLSEENFMAGAKDWLQNLKVRVSFGAAGNNRIKSGLMTTTYSVDANTGKHAYFNEVLTKQLSLSSSLYNPDLKWETTLTRNVGIDFGFWNGRLSGNLDFYYNSTKDLLMSVEVPSNSGYKSQFQNYGETSNKGIEVALNGVAHDDDLWSMNIVLNLSYNKNRIEKLNTTNPWQSSSWSGSTISKYEDFRVVEGGKLGEVWGYETDGFFTAYDPELNPGGELVYDGKAWQLRPGCGKGEGNVDNSAVVYSGAIKPGALKMKTYDSDGVNQDGTAYKAGDPIKKKLGNTVAPVTGGFGINGHIWHFDYNVFCNYSLGNQIVNGTRLALSFYSDTRKNYNLVDDFNVDSRYTAIDPATGANLVGPSSDVLASLGGAEGLAHRLCEINQGKSYYNPATATKMQTTSYAVEDASFLRLQNVTLGYTVPKKATQKGHIDQIRVYVTGYNLAVATKYKGPDPEVDTSSKRNAMTPGVDYAAYPKSRQVVVGLNVTF